MDFDAGACFGEFAEYIYEKYGDALAREYLSRFPEEDIVFYTISDTALVDWTGRIIFMEFTLTFQLDNTPAPHKNYLEIRREKVLD